MAKVLVSTKGLSHTDWLACRRLGIGGSDASIVCRANKYKSPIELWLDKTGQLPYQEAGEAAFWGTTFEPIIRAEFAKRTGMKVIEVNRILQCNKYPFMIANIDGALLCPNHGRCVFESKTASVYKAGEWENGSVPYEYVLQIQHYLSVTGYNGAYIAVLIGGNAFHWRFVPRDEEIISMLINEERDFWQHVADAVPPPPDGSEACVKFLNQRYANSIPKSQIELPVSAADLIRQYTEANEQIEQATIQKNRAGNLLKEMLGANEVGIIGDNRVAWRTVTQERFDNKAFKSEQPELYKKYIHQSFYRRFNIKY
jgi:putative phage-type endonuclease